MHVDGPTPPRVHINPTPTGRWARYGDNGEESGDAAPGALGSVEKDKQKQRQQQQQQQRMVMKLSKPCDWVVDPLPMPVERMVVVNEADEGQQRRGGNGYEITPRIWR
jgi:hypothetical protein